MERAMLFALVIVMAPIPSVTAGEECGTDIDDLECHLEDVDPTNLVCFGIFASPFKASSSAITFGFEPVAEEHSETVWIGFLIAMDGSGPGAHTSFAFVGGVTDSSYCGGDHVRFDHSGQIASYWSSTVVEDVLQIICGGICP